MNIYFVKRRKYEDSVNLYSEKTEKTSPDCDKNSNNAYLNTFSSEKEALLRKPLN